MADKLANVQEYYDNFSTGYEGERYHGYHLLIDELEFAAIKKHIKDKKVLEAGCGTGLILQRIAREAKEAVGIDLSEGMLSKAKEKGLTVHQASVTELPFEDNTFDVVCSFKVLAHVPDINKAISEMARVTKPGGLLILEFYNTKSLRYLVKKLKRPTKTSEKFSDEEVYTRYDNLNSVKSYLSEELKVEKTEGIRIFTPFAGVYKIPVISGIYKKLEMSFRDSFLANLGGFLVVFIRKSNV